MPYVDFAEGKPVIADSGSLVVTNTRENLLAVRDGVIMGVMPDWNMTAAGTADQPSQLQWVKGVYALRAAITWGTSGGSLYNPTIITYSFNGNSLNAGSWLAIGTLTIAYDANGDVTTSTWS